MSINWRYLQRATGVLLLLIFIPLSIADIVASVAGEWLGTDAHLYYRASEAWVAGTNPWDASVTHTGSVYHYYALPTATVLLAPFTLLPESVFVPFWVVVQLAAAAYVIRSLKLRWWWLLFPPLVNGVLAGNPSPILLALLIAPNPLAKAIGPLLKVYGIVPLLGERQWRAIMISGGIGLATVAIGPDLWAEFITGGGERTARQLAESDGGFSAFGNLWLLAASCLALFVIARRDLRAACWLAPIAIWPGSQFHWSTLALPVMTLPMAYLLSLHGLGLPPIAIIVYAAVSELRHSKTWRRITLGYHQRPT